MPHQKKARALKDIFAKHLELDQTVPKRNFTKLHLIILGLSPINLRSYLQTSIAEIDSVCSMGRTPLHWAVTQRNTEAMETLIEFGAGLHLTDAEGYSAIFHAVTLGSTKALKLLLAAMTSSTTTENRTGNVLNGQVKKVETVSNTTFLKFCLEQRSTYTATALHMCAQLQDRSEFARLLLDAGADVDSAFSLPTMAIPQPYKEVPPPIMFSVQSNEHATLKLFLERGAKVDFLGPAERGILHFVALYGNLETIRVVMVHANLEALDSNITDNYGLTPMQCFDSPQRQRYVTEDPTTFQESRDAFLQLLDSTSHRKEFSSNKKFALTREVSFGDLGDGDAELDVFYDAKEGSQILA